MSVDLYNKKIQGYATADDINTEASTLRKDDIYVTNISDPNVLHDFASLTLIVTLVGTIGSPPQSLWALAGSPQERI